MIFYYFGINFKGNYIPKLFFFKNSNTIVFFKIKSLTLRNRKNKMKQYGK